MEKPIILDINSGNMDQYPPACFLNTKHPILKTKLDWIKNRFKEGMKIKQLYFEDMKKAIGFIEYIPSEYAWRAIDAKKYLFVHCIWIYPNKNKKKGYGTLLLDQVIDDAMKNKFNGVCAVVSDGAFMADKTLFLKNGFKEVANDGKDSLLVKQLKNSQLPKFKDYKKQLAKYKGLHILYTDQCPWVSRFVSEIDSKKYNIKITQLKTAKQAQSAPSIYATFNLIKDGKILADRYISKTRFENIIKKLK
jgi:L-amino acid N-acyltransferase YncA